MGVVNRRNLLLAVVAAGLAAAIALAMATMFGSSQAGAETQTAPSWLQQASTGILATCSDPHPASVKWALATGAQFEAASLGHAIPTSATLGAASDTQLYVVVAHGNFTYTAAKLPSGDTPVPTGRTLIVAFDPGTHIMTELSLLVDDVDAEAAIGATGSMLQ